MKLQLHSEFSLSNDGIHGGEYSDLMVSGIYTKIMLDETDTLTEEELEESGYESKLTEIGKIECHRFDLRYSESDLYFVADCHDADLEKVASYFFSDERKELLEDFIGIDAIFYINNVYIKPEYRGKDYGLYALALLLDGIAWGQVVSCHPVPIKDYRGKKNGKLLLKKYWSKLGLKYYDEEHNILWGADWCMPKWIRNKLFPALQENDNDESDVNSDQENLLEQSFLETVDMKAYSEEKVNDFYHFLNCLETNTYRFSSRFLNYVRDYYVEISGISSLIDKLDRDELIEISKKLTNQKGELVFDIEDIDTLIAAKEFALSKDPKKKVKYLCTLEVEFNRTISEEVVKIVATLKFDCISNKYLKMLEDNDEYYEDYLRDMAKEKLIERYPFLEQALENKECECLSEYKILDE